MKNVLIIAGILVALAIPAHAQSVTDYLPQEQSYDNMTPHERELTKEIELLRLQEAVRQRQAYEERMRVHVERMDCIVCK